MDTEIDTLEAEFETELRRPFSRAAYAGDLELVSGMLEDNPELVHSFSPHFKTPILTTAVMGGHIEIVRLLIEKFGAEQNESDGSPAIHWAINLPNWKEMCDLLLENGADINSIGHCGHQIFHDLCLHWEDKKGRDPVGAARYIAAKGADINARNEWGGTPLHCLGPSHGAEFVRTLVELGVEINLLDNFRKTPLDHLEENLRQPEGWTHPGQAYAESRNNARGMAEELWKHGGKRASEL